jgi:ammonium transporter, Amt family
MSELSLLTVGLAFLMPLGYALIAAGGLSSDQARQTTLSLLSALGLAVVGYIVMGFALQYGGAGLVHNQPGLEGLVWEWSALGTTWGSGWGMAGLVGWGLAGPAATSGAYGLAFANLPWVATAALIPLLSLRGRAPSWATGLLGLLMGAIVYPLAGNWVWGGGWLANLGSNLGLGHGLVDVSGAGVVHLLGASAALAGILVLLPRKPQGTPPGAPVPLPSAHLSVLAVFGAGLLMAGGLAWIIGNPMLYQSTLDLSQTALNCALASAAGGLLPLLYTWFVAGRADPLMATRGLAAGSIAGAAIAPFAPPQLALILGAAAGLLVPLLVYALDRILRIDDPTAALPVHGLGGLLGLLGVAVLADGRAGQGWNGVGAGAHLGISREGVAGLLVASGFQPDWPGQLQAQTVGIAALMLFGFFAAWLLFAPPAVLVRLLENRLTRVRRRLAMAGATSATPVATDTPVASVTPSAASEPEPVEPDAPPAIEITPQ